MNARAYLIFSGIIFGLVAVLHLLRALNGWGFDVGPWSLPISASWIGVAISGGLSFWAARLVLRGRRDSAA